MSEHRDHEPEDLVERAVAALRQLPLPGGPSAAVISQTSSALREAAHRPRINVLQRITQMPWTFKTSALLGIAASLLAIYFGLLNLTGGALAFADVVAVLEKVRSATWRTATEVEMPHNQKVKSIGEGMFLAPSHERIEFVFQGSKGISIIDGEQGKILTLDPTGKTALVIDVKNVPPGQESPFGRTFQGLQEFVAEVQKDSDGKVERLGINTIDGRPAAGFRLEKGTFEVKIWADPNTSRPVRVEYTSISGPKSHSVMSDFQVDVDLDASLFRLEVPKDYTVQQPAQLDLSKDPITYLADTLKLTAELNDGIFPATLRGEEGIEGILSNPQKLAKKFAEMAGKDSPDELRNLGVELSMKLGGTFGMLGAMSPEQNDWHYAGKGVKLNTPDRPIFWFRRHRASTTYQVLYADLSVKEVPADEVPKAEDLPGGGSP